MVFGAKTQFHRLTALWKLLKLLYFPRFHLSSVPHLDPIPIQFHRLHVIPHPGAFAFNNTNTEASSIKTITMCQTLICCSSHICANFVQTCMEVVVFVFHRYTHNVQNGAVMVASLKQWELQSVSRLAGGRRCEANTSLPTVTRQGEGWEDRQRQMKERERQREVDRWREKCGRMETEQHGRRWTSDSRISAAEPATHQTL